MSGLFPTRVAAAVALAFTSTVLIAQETTSSIRGSVNDAGGAAVSGATVSIVHTPSGTTSTVTTGTGGAFSATGLRPGGPYKVTVAANGLEAKSVEGFYLSVGEPLNLPVSLAPAALEELDEVAVTGSRSLTLSSGPTTTFSRDDIEGITSVQRDIRDIAKQDPFASFNPTTRGVSIAGQNNRTNRFSVDGVRFSDNFGLNQGGLPTTKGPVPLDAVEQMSVKVAPYDITEGDFQGGSINVVMRAGSNDYTGSVFYSYNSDALTGDKSRGTDVNLDFTSKNWGAFISGPILENKLFFAASYENLKAGDPADFGLAGAPNPVPGLTQGILDNVQNISETVYNYDTLGLRSIKPEEDDKYTGKLDWNIFDGQRLSYTVIHQKTYQQSFSTGGTGSPPFINTASYATNEPEKVTSQVVQWNSDWANGLSTELRANYRKSSKIPSSLGAAGYSQFQICTDATSTGSFTACGTSPRVYTGVEQFSQADVVGQKQYGLELVGRYALGDHAFKAQAAVNKLEIENVFVQSALGIYYFDSIASYQNRAADQFSWQYAINGDLNSLSASFDYDQYTVGLQDSWNLLPSLNVTYGLRYDTYKMSDEPPVNQPFVTRYGGAFDNTNTIDGYGVLQPRISATWKPLPRLQLRAGFGLFNGGSPDVFLGNSFSVAGVYQNTITITRNTSAAGCDAGNAPLCAAALNGVTGIGTELPNNTLVNSYLATNTASLAAAPVNSMVDDFKLPSSWKANLSADYLADIPVLGDWNFGVDVYAGWAKAAVAYRDIRLADSGNRSPDGRIIYRYLGTAANNADLQLYNNHKAHSTIVVGRIDKEWDFGLGAGVSYTWQDVKSTSDMTTTTALQGGTTANGSYATAPSALDPNVGVYGTSSYEIPKSVKLNLNFSKALFGDNKTRVSLYWEWRSGTPYSLTMGSGGSGRSIFGTYNTSSSGIAQRYLLYVPDVSSETADSKVQYGSTAVYNAFRNYVEARDLPQGGIIGKNSERSPYYTKWDLHLEQELPGFKSKFKLFADVENVLNLINDKYGSFRYFDTNVPVVAVACVGGSGGNGGTCPKYNYTSFTAPVQRTDGRIGLWSLRLGMRLEF